MRLDTASDKYLPDPNELELQADGKKVGYIKFDLSTFVDLPKQRFTLKMVPESHPGNEVAFKGDIFNYRGASVEFTVRAVSPENTDARLSVSSSQSKMPISAGLARSVN